MSPALTGKINKSPTGRPDSRKHTGNRVFPNLLHRHHRDTSALGAGWQKTAGPGGDNIEHQQVRKVHHRDFASLTIWEMIKGEQVIGDTPVIDGQIQPFSIDLRLDERVLTWVNAVLIGLCYMLLKRSYKIRS